MRLTITDHRPFSAHRVVHRTISHRRSAAFFSCAFVSNSALLAACIDQRPLFAEIAAAPDSAGTGVEVPSAPATGTSEASAETPDASDETSPAGAALTGMTGAPGLDPSKTPLPPNASDPSDAGTPPSAPGADTDEACNNCLSNECSDAIESCNATPGCGAVSACARSTGCIADACYCGTVNLVLCATTGDGNGPCRDVILAAPESHEPTALAPSGGPAADAAQLVGDCRRTSVGCQEVCRGPTR
jgi:hypothetical protein